MKKIRPMMELSEGRGTLSVKANFVKKDGSQMTAKEHNECIDGLVCYLEGQKRDITK